jgi:hypothetical protein
MNAKGLVLFASTLFLTYSGAGAGARSAWAQKKKVVLEQFSGPSSDRFRQLVQASLGKQDVEIISDKKVANAEADLGLIAVSDAYSAAAKQLGNGAFVGGSISGAKKPKAKLVVKGADGGAIGEESWTADNSQKLMAAIGENLDAKLGALLGGAGAGAVATTKDPPAEKAAAKSEKGPEKKKAAADDDEWQASDKKKASADSGDKKASDEGDKAEAQAEVRAESSDDGGDDTAGPRGMNLALAVGVKFLGRHFVYHDNLAGGQQDYKLPQTLMPYVPTPNLTIEFFPIKWVGAQLGGEYSVGLISKDKAGDLYKTVAYAFQIGVRGDVPVGPVALEPYVGYGVRVFRIDPLKDDPTPPQVAGVDYRHLRLGGGVRLPVMNGNLQLIAGGLYLHILSAGQITGRPSDEADSTDKSFFFYPKKTMGGEGFAGAIIRLPFVKGLDARITLDLRRIVYTFDYGDDLAAARMRAQSGKEPRVAGGATDQYIGLNVAAGYNLGL